MFQEGWRALQDNFDELVPRKNVLDIFQLKLGWNNPYVEISHKFVNGVLQTIKYPHNEPKFDCDIFGIPGDAFC